MKKTLLIALLLFSTSTVEAMENHSGHMSKYKGQENRTIKSLSSDDIKELKEGGGWGFAKAAELNGYPGPAHILMMKQEISLNDQQVHKITALHSKMKSKAIELGNKLIDLEGVLETHFSSKSITDDILQALLLEISEVKRELRYTHLITHLKTPEILSEDQVKKYNSLRGY